MGVTLQKQGKLEEQRGLPEHSHLSLIMQVHNNMGNVKIKAN